MERFIDIPPLTLTTSVKNQYKEETHLIHSWLTLNFSRALNEKSQLILLKVFSKSKKPNQAPSSLLSTTNSITSWAWKLLSKMAYAK